MPELSGGRQFGPYRLLSQIATGGMAEIHLASARGLSGFEKVVALKMIHPNFSSDDHFVEMLVDEAKISVQLQHVNIAHVFDLGKVDDTYYIAMEFVDGSDLFKVLRKASEQDRAMPIETAVYIGKEVCGGLDYAHRKRDAGGRSMGIVHRDVSPQNVLVSHAGEVKIVDFGIAKASMRARQTAAGVIKGKYYYMSPEQAWGDPVDARTDIFSAGILVYEMLTGQMLYLEEDMNKLLDRVRKADIPPPSTKRRDVPRELDRIVMRALSKKPDTRWQSAHDFGAALEDFLHGYAPDFSASRLASFVNTVVPPAPPPAVPVAMKPDETARLTRGVMQSRSEFTDENSVIYRLGQKPEFSPDPPAPPPRPQRISANRLTRASSPPATMTLDESRAASTLVSQPGFAGLGGGTIELTPDMMEPVEREPEGTIELTVAGQTLEPRETVTKDVTVATPRPAPVAASASASASSSSASTSTGAATTTPSGPPSFSSSPVAAPRRSRRTPGAGVPVAVAARLSAPLPLSAPPLDDSAESAPVRPVDIWPPRSTFDTDGDDPGVRIGHFNGKRLLVGLLVALALVGIAAFAIAAFSGGPAAPVREDAALVVISVPQGARVLANGSAVGTSPVKIDHLPVGKPVQLRVELDRYQPWQEVEEVSRAGSIDIVASLRPIRGTLTVVSNPPGAEVFFGSRSLGVTPLVMRDMDPFTDGTVEVRKEGHRPSRQALTWAKALEATLTFDLVSSGN